MHLDRDLWQRHALLIPICELANQVVPGLGKATGEQQCKGGRAGLENLGGAFRDGSIRSSGL
jgi:hypothetical protein